MKDSLIFKVTYGKEARYGQPSWYVVYTNPFSSPVVSRHEKKADAVKKGREVAKEQEVPAILKIENKDGDEIERNSYNF